MRNLSSYALCAVLAGVGAAGCTSSSSNGPTILQITPSVTTDTANAQYIVDIIVDFDDSAYSGDLADAYTFQTSDGQVNDVDVAIPPSASPFTISGLILPFADYQGHASVDFHLELYGEHSGLGSRFDGTITIN